MAAASREERNWTELHIDILESIASRLCLPDYYVFRSVCTSWRHVNTLVRGLHRPCPLLMFPRDPTAKTSTPRGFFCVQNKKIYQIPLPRVVVRSWCCGSSHGWFIMAHKTRGNFLFNPFSSARIQLPTHPVLYDWVRDRPRLFPFFITKAILSAEPTLDAIAADRCVVAAMFDNEFLAFCRPGDQKWTWTTNLMEDDDNDHIEDGDSDVDDVDDGDNDGDSTDDDDDDDDHIEDEDSDVDDVDGDNDGDSDDDDDDIEDGDSDVDEVDGDNDGDSDDADDIEYQKRLLGIKTLFKISDEKHEDELDVEEEEEEEGDDCDEDEEEEEIGGIDGVEDVEEESNNIDDEDEEEVPTATHNVINDIIFHKGKLYAITQKLEVYVCEFVENGIISKRILQTQPLKLKRKEIRSYRSYYLVESCCGKELLMVVRVAPENDFELMTKKFIVFKLNYSNDHPPNWVRVENIGDQILFLGQNHSVSISATDFPPASVQGNCIYHSDDLHNLHFMARIYRLNYKYSCMFSLDPPKKDQSIQFFPKKYPTSLMVSYPHSYGFPPVWITPNP